MTKSRKISVAEKKRKCKAQGLVYDKTTGQCRSSKRGKRIRKSLKIKPRVSSRSRRKSIHSKSLKISNTGLMKSKTPDNLKRAQAITQKGIKKTTVKELRAVLKSLNIRTARMKKSQMFAKLQQALARYIKSAISKSISQNKSRSSVSKSSKKLGKRLTVSEMRKLCKQRGLVYDAKTKQCRPSKKGVKSRKARIKKSSKVARVTSKSHVAKFNHAFKTWANNLDQSLPITLTYSKSQKTTPEIDKSTETTIKHANVPANALSPASWTPYVGDSDYDNSKFVKLSTCQRSCPNEGVFAKEDIDSLLEMTGAHAGKCPFCSEKFKLVEDVKRPPYGTMTISTEHSGYGKVFYAIDFDMKSGTKDGKYYGSRTQTAYFPVSPEGLLGVWLMIEAFKVGKMWRLGYSMTHGRFGIVFGAIHMKTRTRGGLSNHGYGNNPVQDLKQSVLPNLIQEANSVGIFTPEQLDDFAKQTQSKFRFKYCKRCGRNKFRMIRWAQ